MRDIALHSSRGEIPFIYSYIALLISSILIFILLINLQFPKVDYSTSFYSCFLNSFEGNVACKFPDKLHVYANGGIIHVNDKTFESPKSIHVNCISNSFVIQQGDIKCGKMS